MTTNSDHVFSWVDGKLCFGGSKPTTMEQAFDISIEKYELIIQRGDLSEDGSWRTCGLCLLYKVECKECPIGKEGCRCCDNTPYMDLYHAQGRNDLNAYLEAARQELEFLKKLKVKYCAPGG